MDKKAYTRAVRKLDAEMKRQIDIQYPAFGIALNNLYGWKAVHLARLYDMTEALWQECGADNTVSILDMLENETGIEMKLDGCSKSFHELAFYNAKLDVGGKPIEEMTAEMWVATRLGQVKWIGCGVQAALLLTLKRREGFGVERISNVYQEAIKVRKEHKDRVRDLKKTLHSQTGMNF